MLELRTAADAERLKAALGPGRRLAIVGGGYIGLEAAASARALGADAVVVERENRLLPRVACGDLSAFFHRYHEARGVDFESRRQVDSIAGRRAARSAAVSLSDGRAIACDAVLVGVGAIPNDGTGRGRRPRLRQRRGGRPARRGPPTPPSSPSAT